MYINELIKAKTSQAQILDEANRVHESVAIKMEEIKIKEKMLKDMEAKLAS
jgi:hypothetical protein